MVLVTALQNYQVQNNYGIKGHIFEAMVSATKNSIQYDLKHSDEWVDGMNMEQIRNLSELEIKEMIIDSISSNKPDVWEKIFSEIYADIYLNVGKVAFIQINNQTDYWKNIYGTDFPGDVVEEFKTVEGGLEELLEASENNCGSDLDATWKILNQYNQYVTKNFNHKMKKYEGKNIVLSYGDHYDKSLILTANKIPMHIHASKINYENVSLENLFLREFINSDSIDKSLVTQEVIEDLKETFYDSIEKVRNDLENIISFNASQEEGMDF